MTDVVGDDPACPRPLKMRQRAPNWLVILLLIVIVANELQRTWAQAAGHRERVELQISMAEMNRKIEWLLLTRQPTSSVPRVPPALGQFPSAVRR